MLHPVGPLRARVYWRRRLVVLVVLLTLLAGAAWGTVRLVRPAPEGAPAAAASSTTPAGPALERALPSLAAVRTPGTAARVPAPETRRPPSTAPARAPASPVETAACGEDVVELRLRAPTTVTAGAKVRIELVVTNVSDTSCVQRLDAAAQEVRMADEGGSRRWGSNDCLREGRGRSATLAPGQEVVLPVEWSGRTSEPTCTRRRTVPPPGVYLLRGSLGDARTPLRRIRLT